MNKYFNVLTLTAAILATQATSCVHAPVEFAKLTPKITRNAEPWSQDVFSTLDTELQLAWANFFALLLEGQPTKALIKCAEYIESHDEMTTSSQELAFSTIQILQEYSEKVEEKISRRKNMTEEEEETLLQKLETKIQELIVYINAIYYEYIYSNLVTKSSSTPAYMFDDNGFIPQAQRTRALPQP
jgi:Skp family chaperone for outer membrane proteins